MTVSRRTVIGGAAATGLSLAGAGWAGSPAAAAPASAARRPRVPGPLVPDPAGLVALPPGFTYRLVSVAGQTSLVSGERRARTARTGPARSAGGIGCGWCRTTSRVRARYCRCRWPPVRCTTRRLWAALAARQPASPRPGTECRPGGLRSSVRARGVLAEGEAVGLSAGFGEGDLDGAVGDGAGLADELVHPLLGEGAVAVAVGVGSVGLAGWVSVDADPER
jgi:hypothetical protein